MARSAFSAEEKYELIIAFENRKTSSQDFCRQNKISEVTIRNWIYLFKTYGIDGLKGVEGWKIYSKELKTAAVLDYLSGKYSSFKIIRKYEISSRSVLQRWVKD